MPKRTIVLLANSVKWSSRCIAGRELLDLDSLNPGEWLRPVSTHGEGEVDFHESALPDGSQPEVLDIVSVPLTERCDDVSQPENWQIDTRQRWRKLARFPLDRVQDLVDDPEDLWLQPGVGSETISADFLQQHPVSQSLCLIRPEGFRMEGYSEPGTDQPYPVRYRRARFSYNGTEYDLAITDPVVNRKYFRPFPGPSQPRKTITPSCGDRCLLCVSLGGNSGGVHTKFVAAVIEPE